MPNPPNKIKCSKDLLQKWYVKEKRSYRWIMDQLNCNTARGIKRLLTEYGIEVRHGSEAVATQWINNEERRIKAGETANKSFFHTRRRPSSEQKKRKIGLANKGKNNGMWGKFGKENPCWLGGKLPRKVPDKNRKQAFERAKHKCEKCGATDRLTIHHWPPYRECRSHDLKFLQVLCHTCHFCQPHHLK